MSPSFASHQPSTIEPPAGTDDLNVVQREGRTFFQISQYDQLPPFLMHLASASDLWCYISSHGGLTAGRVSADQTLFAYLPEDQLHDAHHYSGPHTQLWFDRDAGTTECWQPFDRLGEKHPLVQRRLLKSLIGNEIVFEESREDLQLTFSYGWIGVEKLGFVRSVSVSNDSDRPVSLRVLDGVRHVLPWGLTAGLYSRTSCLTRAYTRAELDTQSQLATYCLTSGIVDDAHPCEILRANVVWCCGLPLQRIHLDDRVFADEALLQQQPAAMVAGQRVAFGAYAGFELPPGESKVWHLVMDCGLDHAALVTLRQMLLEHPNLGDHIETQRREASQDLIRLVASADGMQDSEEGLTSAHHFANVLFNSLRGGVFVDNHDIQSRDFSHFVQQRNVDVAQKFGTLLAGLPDHSRIDELLGLLRQQEDPDLLRLGYEFLPISYSRRHGDPSRPWNHFAIQLKNEDGSQAVHYEGNWRDIFQNWEALCRSYPGFIASVIAKFVNGSTVDGFNPYRITSKGLEWEMLEPDDPWSNIGYWGDHQIIYLLKLLESCQDHQPDQLAELLQESCFVYLSVPYRIRPYSELVKHPRDSIEFDNELNSQLAKRVSQRGEDGKLLSDGGEIYHVNLLEKLLVPALAKLSNFVAGAGIWMNTQRPEWNDANNALVGYGTSFVTLCYLRRYLNFLVELLDAFNGQVFEVSREVAQWLTQVFDALQEHRDILEGNSISDRQRRSLLDQLGQAFCDYRTLVYDHGLSQKISVRGEDLTKFCRLAMRYADQTIRSGSRPDALYDSYSVIEFSSQDELRVRPLYEMLEGQVAVISSGTLSSDEVADLVDAMFLSRMYRADQHSFMLYPERTLADFVDRNVVPAKSGEAIPLLRELLAAEDRSLIYQDDLGVYRFAAFLQRRSDVASALDRLCRQPRWATLVAQDAEAVQQLFEQVFQHHTYTGRSGSMYGYEGIGSIYWHMVSKLLLAVQERFIRACEAGEDESARRLGDLYYRIRGGLSWNKTPREYGAFPTDPYSHTPSHGGAQQPGMTGQVKEEILTRFGELGVTVHQGRVSFRPRLLKRSEFARHGRHFQYVDLDETLAEIELPQNCLAFTYCQVPIVYTLSDNAPRIQLKLADGRLQTVQGCELDAAQSAMLLGRTYELNSICVDVEESELYRERP